MKWAAEAMNNTHSESCSHCLDKGSSSQEALFLYPRLSTEQKQTFMEPALTQMLLGMMLSEDKASL